MNSQFEKGVFWSLASLVVLALGGGLINLVIINLRDESVLGVFNQIFAFYIIFSQLGVGGIQYSVLKQISYHQNDLKVRSEIANSAMLLVAVLALVIAILIGLVANQIGLLLDSPDVGTGLKLVAPGLFFFTLNKVLLGILNGANKMRQYAIFQSLRYILLPLFLWGLISYNCSNPQLSLSLTFAEIFLFVGLSWYVYRNVVSFRQLDNLISNMYGHLHFGARSVLSGFLTEFNTRVDVIFIGYFLSDAYVGLYTFIAFIIEGVGQLAYAVRWNVDPLLGHMFSNGTISIFLKKAQVIRNRTYFFVGILGFIIVLLYPVVIRFFVPDINVEISWVVLTILMVGVVANSGYRPFIGLLLQGGKPALHSLFMFILVVNNVILNLLLVPWLNVYGSAMATSLTFMLEAFLIYYFSKKVFDLDLISMRYLR